MPRTQPSLSCCPEMNTYTVKNNQHLRCSQCRLNSKYRMLSFWRETATEHWTENPSLTKDYDDIYFYVHFRAEKKGSNIPVLDISCNCLSSLNFVGSSTMKHFKSFNVKFFFCFLTVNAIHIFQLSSFLSSCSSSFLLLSYLIAQVYTRYFHSANYKEE